VSTGSGLRTAATIVPLPVGQLFLKPAIMPDTPLPPSIPFLFRPRGYVHFDAPVSSEVAEQIATDPAAVTSHPFYPFILHTVTTQKIHKKAGGGVEKKAPKDRPIAYAAHKDSHIFAHYSAILESHYEPMLVQRGLNDVVTAFRSLHGRCNIHFANEAFEFIRAQDSCAVIASDISDFFNQLNHRTLKRAWAHVLEVRQLPADHYAVFKAITGYSLVDRDQLYTALGVDILNPRATRRHRICTAREFRERVRGTGLCIPNRTGKGIPQGSPISAVLANIYMLEFDAAMNSFVTQHAGFYRRYCDDLLIVMPTAELRQEVLTLGRTHLQELGLEAHPEKTELIDFVTRNNRLSASKPLNYLGFTFDGMHKRVRPASIARYYKKMRRGVGRAKAVRWRVNIREHNRVWTPLRTRKLHLLYSYLGRHNFTTYVFRAARIMGDPGMKKQIKAHWNKLHALIGDAH
jgi:RNA-directed DNA polymerase